jgi:membrane protein YqaA with SNARE-associated domain
MLIEVIQAATRRRGGITSYLGHLGAFGLFFFAILDSSPLPTFGGPDILIAIFAARHRDPWYEYAVVATAGSVIGAFITFKLARRAGTAYLESKFRHGKLNRLREMFDKWETSALAVSTAVPLPLPTSVFFAVAGASDYGVRKYIAVVALCRAARYSLIAFLADRYGRHFIRVIRHPDRYWGWLLLIAAVVLALVLGSVLLNRKLESEAGRRDREYVR